MEWNDADYADVVAWRRDLHPHPELQFEVRRTAAFVAAKLEEFGCDEVITGIGKTGVVGIIPGQKQTSGKVIGLRADMDALPIEEESGVAWASTTKGVMHACGHDGHTAMLLGAARCPIIRPQPVPSGVFQIQGKETAQAKANSRLVAHIWTMVVSVLLTRRTSTVLHASRSQPQRTLQLEAGLGTASGWRQWDAKEAPDAGDPAACSHLFL